MQDVGSHLTRIMAVNQDPSNYMQMEAASYHEANSEHELDEMRVNRELNDMRFLMDRNQENSFGREQQNVSHSRDF